MFLPYGVVRLWQKRFEYYEKMNKKKGMGKLLSHFVPYYYLTGPVVLDSEAKKIFRKIR